MFNSPLHYCSVCTQYVATDQTKRECAQEHGCKVAACPLAHLFTSPEPEQPEVASAGSPASATTPAARARP